jgi:hypothetical protein
MAPIAIHSGNAASIRDVTVVATLRRRWRILSTGIARRRLERYANASARGTATLVTQPKQCVELREFEKRLEVLVEVRQTEFPTPLANPLCEGHQNAEPRAVDVAGVAEVDEKPALAIIERIEHDLLQLLSIRDDELAFHANYDGIAALVRRKTHLPSCRFECAAMFGPANRVAIELVIYLRSPRRYRRYHCDRCRDIEILTKQTLDITAARAE